MSNTHTSTPLWALCYSVIVFFSLLLLWFIQFNLSHRESNLSVYKKTRHTKGGVGHDQPYYCHEDPLLLTLTSHSSFKTLRWDIINTLPPNEVVWINQINAFSVTIIHLSLTMKIIFYIEIHFQTLTFECKSFKHSCNNLTIHLCVRPSFQRDVFKLLLHFAL